MNFIRSEIFSKLNLQNQHIDFT